MPQHYLEKGVTTYLLPYPQTYEETKGSISADYTFMSGTVERDFAAYTAEDFFEKFEMSWQDQVTSDFETILSAFLALTEEDGWTYVGPDAVSHTVMLNPSSATMEGLRYAGVGGNVLWECKLSLVTDDS